MPHSQQHAVPLEADVCTKGLVAEATSHRLIRQAVAVAVVRAQQLNPIRIVSRLKRGAIPNLDFYDCLFLIRISTTHILAPYFLQASASASASARASTSASASASPSLTLLSLQNGWPS